MIAGLIVTGLIAATGFLLHWYKIKRSSRSGVQRIYPRGKNIRNMKTAIRKADKVCVIEFMAQGFMNEYRDTIEARLKEFPDFKMLLMLVNPQSQCSIDQERLSNKARGYHQNLLNVTFSILTTINNRAGNPLTPFFEERKFRTEIRNNIILCKRREHEGDHIQAWINLALPMAARHSPTLELDAEKSKMHYNYFNTLWNDYDPAMPKNAAVSKQAAKKS